MATKYHNLSDYDADALPSADILSRQRYAIVVADWNSNVTFPMCQGAIDTLVQHGVPLDNIVVKHVPGTFELTYAAKTLQRQESPHAIIVIGCVVQGDTPHFDYVFAMAPRVTLASMMAFLCGSTVNAWIMSRMKVASHGKRFPLRAIVSSIGGETVDSLIFFPIAFWGLGVTEMLQLMATQIVLKTLYEVIVLPVTVRVVKYIKRVDDTDVYDEHISYNVLKIKEI